MRTKAVNGVTSDETQPIPGITADCRPESEDSQTELDSALEALMSEVRAEDVPERIRDLAEELSRALEARRKG